MFAPLLLAGAALAQAPTLPPDEALRQIRTPRFTVIYPGSAEAEAQRVASALEAVAGEVEQSLGEHPRRLRVVLNNQYTLSNGYVTLAPRHSGWWTVPIMEGDPQIFGTSLSWLDALAVHEYRHVVQYDHARRGATAALYGLFGETGWLISSALAIPPWFWEGDAVVTETALTRGGRGRTPAFLLDLRVELLEEGIPKYETAVVGSFRRHHADHYTLGYALAAYGTSHFDPQLWSRVSERAARWSFLPFPFSRALSREIGLNLPDLHHLAMYELQRGWEASQIARAPLLEPRPLHPAPEPSSYTRYQSPQPQPDGAVIAFRAGVEDAGSVVRVRPDGEVELLARTGVRPQSRIAARGGRVIWDETRFHPRWTFKSWSVLRSLEIETGEIRDLTRETRLFSPTLSPDGGRVAAVEVARDGGQTLVVLDARTGADIQRYPAPLGEALRSPSWVEDADAVVLVRQHPRQGVALGRLDLVTAVWEQLTPFAHTVLSEPVERGGRVYFVSGEAGAEDPWALDRATGRRWRLGSAKHGAYSLALRPDREALVYADAARGGQGLVELPLEPAPEAAGPGGALPTEPWLAPIVAAEAPPAGDVLAGIEEKTWESRPYRRVAHALDLHSWAPVIRTAGEYGAELWSADVTGSASGSLGAWYNPGEAVAGGEASLSWEASPLAVDLAVGLGGRSVAALATEGRDVNDGLQTLSQTWRERSAGLGLRLPLRGGRGPWVRAASLSLWGEAVEIADIAYHGVGASTAGLGGPAVDGVVGTAGVDLSLSQQTLYAKKELGPRLSQTLALSWARTLPGSVARGGYAAARLDLAFPGLLPLHRLGLGLGAEKQDADGYTFASAGLYPRGYDFTSQDLVSVARADYALPLLYPDLGLGGWVRFTRLRADLFYDHGLVVDDGAWAARRAAGLELVADTHLMRSLGSLGLGLRVSYLLDEGRADLEPVIGGSF